MPLLLFLCFLAIPVVEIYVIIQIGTLIGTWLTVALLVADSILGAWIVRREGIRAWRALRETMLSGKLPDRELADAVLIMAGGALLLTPGFVTDGLGFVVVLPFTRLALRKVLVSWASRRVEAQASQAAAGFPYPPPHGHSYDQPHNRPHQDGGPHPGSHRVVRGDVIDGDVIDDDRGQ